jgi:O-antigen ligase
MNHNYSSDARIIKNYVFLSLTGVLIGSAFIVACNFPQRWFYAAVAGMVLLSILMISIDHIEKLLFFLFVFSLSIELGVSFFYEPYSGGGHELRLSLSDIFFVMLLASWRRATINRNKADKLDKKLSLTIAIFIILSILSLFAAINIPLGLFEIIRLIKVMFIFFFFAYYIDSQNKLNTAISISLIALLAHLFIGAFQWIYDKDLGLGILGERSMQLNEWSSVPLVRIGGLIGHPNAFALYLTITLPLCLYMFVHEKRPHHRIFYITLLISGTLMIIATQSRGAWAACFLGFAMVSVIFLIRAKRYKINRLVIMSCILIITGILASLSYKVINKRIMLDDKKSAASRIPMMIDSLNMIKHNPLIGVGINNYTLAIPSYDVTGIHHIWRDTVVHNLFLLVAAESGIFSSICFIVIWMAVMMIVAKIIGRPRKEQFVLGLSFLFSITSFLVISMVDPNYRFYPAVQRQLWFVVGLILAAYRLFPRKAEPTSK